MLGLLRQQVCDAGLGYGYLLSFRWLAWLLALFQSMLGLPITASPSPLLPWLVITGAYNLCLTIAWLRHKPFERRLLRSNWLLCIDTAALLLLSLATGGWHSPLYQYSFSAFILPSYRFGVRGALVSGTLLVAWHGLLAVMRSSSLVIIASTTLAAILFGVALIMAASMIKIVEEQRQVVRRQATHEANLRLAHHVHDETLQQMYGVILALKGAIARITPGTERGRLQATLDLAVQSWEDLRCFLQDLRTSGEELPLRESLRQRAAAFTHLTGLPVHLECSTTETPIPFEAATHLRAIVREALSNVYRHARATAVWIRLRTEDNMVILEIEDDGVGFDPASGHESNGHYGLAGMSERVTSMRGRLLVESAPDQRTRIIVRVPISIAQAE